MPTGEHSRPWQQFVLYEHSCAFSCSPSLAVALTVSDLVVIGLKDEQMLDESGGEIAMGRVTLARKNTMACRKRTPCSSQASDRA